LGKQTSSTTADTKPIRKDGGPKMSAKKKVPKKSEVMNAHRRDLNKYRHHALRMCSPISSVQLRMVLDATGW
jgi:hypothetical protein